MGTIAIQTQCCLQERDDRETDEEEDSQEEKVQLVEPVHWRSGGGLAGAPSRTRATAPRRSDSETTLVPG